MKKIFLFAALAGIVFASCSKETPVAVVQNEGQQEITFSALSKAVTKGVLGSGSSFDKTGRTIIASGVVKNGNTWVDFLEDATFSEEGETGKWKSAGKYYPLGTDVTNFLAYSETAIPTTGNRKPITARWYGAKEVELQVSEKCDTVDIVYAAFKGDKSATATDGVSAVFKHAQALVTVNIKTSGSGQEIKINKIGFEDVKTSGTLNIKLTPGDGTVSTDANATATWIYNAGCTCHFAEMSAYNLGETAAPADADIVADKETYFKAVADQLPGTVDNTGETFDKFFPAQELATKTMVINYTLGDITADARLTWKTAIIAPEDPVTWEAGKRYVYTITVNPSEIVINPSSDGAWTIENLTGTYN